MIAREAGVAPPSVYGHFPNAEAMVEAVVRECWRQMGEEVAQGSQARVDADPFSTLCGQMGAFVGYAMERPSRYQLLYAMQMDVDAWRDLAGPIRPAYRPILETIERLAADGVRLPMPDTQSTAILILSIAHGRIALAHLAPHQEGNSAQGVEAFVRQALNGLLATRVVPSPLKNVARRRSTRSALKRTSRPSARD